MSEKDQRGSGMLPGGPRTLVGHVWVENVFLKTKRSNMTKQIMKRSDLPHLFFGDFLLTSRPHMAALADPPEARYSYIDPLLACVHPNLGC